MTITILRYTDVYELGMLQRIWLTASRLYLDDGVCILYDEMNSRKISVVNSLPPNRITLDFPRCRLRRSLTHEDVTERNEYLESDFPRL